MVWVLIVYPSARTIVSQLALFLGERMTFLLLTRYEAKEADTINLVWSEGSCSTLTSMKSLTWPLKNKRKTDPAVPLQRRICNRFCEVLSLNLLLPTVPQWLHGASTSLRICASRVNVLRCACLTTDDNNPQNTGDPAQPNASLRSATIRSSQT